MQGDKTAASKRELLITEPPTPAAQSSGTAVSIGAISALAMIAAGVY